MHAVTLSGGGSPRKRTFSRGLSEDESLRSIIKEADSSSRRLTRSDSRTGTLKKRSDSQHSEQDLFMGLPDMLDLQASYDEVVQEMRGLEVEREALLFQVDVLQDTLESVEELLAEAQREAGQASLELEQERGAKRKLESMVYSLMQEVERLKEERNNAPAPVHVPGSDEQSAVSEPHSSESSSKMSEAVEQHGQAEDEGNIIMKLRRMVNKPLGHTPSLALNNQPAEDGILGRPFENGLDSRDPSPDSNESDNISAYEDASAETPEQDRLFPGDGDTLELPDDSENKEKSPASNCQVQDNRNPESCTVS